MSDDDDGGLVEEFVDDVCEVLAEGGGPLWLCLLGLVAFVIFCLSRT